MSDVDRFAGRPPLVVDGLTLLDRCDGGGLFLRDKADHAAILRLLNAPLLWEGDQA